MSNKIAITVGDLLGIGEEIIIKALLELNLPKDTVLIIGKDLGLGHEYVEIDRSSNGDFCYKSLEAACVLANEGKISAIVTGPVSKKALYDAGYNFSGQTEILDKLLDGKAQMLFVARDLRLMLLTRHIPLRDVSLDENMIIEKILCLNSFLKDKCNIAQPKIALCALNPHAGENGLLGREEIDIMSPAMTSLKNLGVQVFGPFAADGLFAKIGERYLKNIPQEYDAIVSPYHDQGLCAIKALAFDEVVNTTIGLKVIRTSPSSGTAYDIRGKGIAKHQSMTEAIKLALKLS